MYGRLPSKKDLETARNAADNVEGKLILGFGGHGRSAGFGQMTMLKSRRKKFLQAVKDLLDEYELDGVDFNWEFPNTPKEWQNWGLLMQEAKLLLAPRNLVSFTMYNMEDLYDLLVGYNLISHADYVHCMAYDNRDKHSTFEFAQMGVMMAQKFGSQMRKWTLGIPFYGRNMKTGEPKPYYDLVVKNSQLPQLDNTSDIVDGIFYNSQLTVYNKVMITRMAGVGGVMIWELGQDIQPYITQSDGTTTTTTSDDRSLMTAVQRGILSTELDDVMSQVDRDERNHYNEVKSAGDDISDGGSKQHEL